ncbi:MAG TPA: hypothetical protein V6C58_11775 [Allocoleopsis sp.]
MANLTSISQAPDISNDDYILLGVATCFIKEEGEVHQVKVIEPIPSAALEAILKGIPTSYTLALATTVGAILKEDKWEKPSEIPDDAEFAENFTERAIAAIRTFKIRPQATSHIPMGTSYHEFNYSVERKRVLNQKRVINKEDNVKQHEYTHQVL